MDLKDTMACPFLQVNPNTDLMLLMGDRFKGEGDVGTSELRYRCQDSPRCGGGNALASGGSEKTGLVRAEQSRAIC